MKNYYTCVENYFIIGTICQVCDSFCKTCLGTSMTCTSCNIGVFLSHPCVLLVSTIQMIVQHALIIIKHKIIFNVFAMPDIIIISQINVNNVQHHAKIMKIIQMFVFLLLYQVRIQYKYECQNDYFQADSQTCKQYLMIFINVYVKQVGFSIQMVSLKFNANHQSSLIT
ncbi:unnamed protein product [Paramecium sonneborni]|uniref:Transmembrane protein n=1 Tax=Paramecium sonneborni TaxID=65129 RepID=A0A8S1RLC4_9CILI|nr:unnamed protein product [Paramecium sonneborni]